MHLQNIITKEDLGEPYKRLTGILNINEIITLASRYSGEQIRFGSYVNIIDSNPELVLMFGYDKAAKIANVFHNNEIYFPHLRSTCRKKITDLIRTEFNGSNYSELANKYGYTSRHIRRLINGLPKRDLPDDRQISLSEISSV